MDAVDHVLCVGGPADGTRLALTTAASGWFQIKEDGAPEPTTYRVHNFAAWDRDGKQFIMPLAAPQADSTADLLRRLVEQYKP